MLLRKTSCAVASLTTLLVWLQLCCNSSAQEPVQFVFMISTSTNDTPVEKDTSGAVPAVEMALEQINNQADLLEGYKLEMSAGSPINSEVKNAHGQA